jgi:outer membrane murein-binding lipoprotein Lpp
MAITGLESKASSALTALEGADHVAQQVGTVVKELAAAIEQLSRELDELKSYVRDLETEANRHLKDEIEER